MLRTRSLFSCLAALVLGGCATFPTGPSVMVMPAPGKPFEQFQADDAVCRQWAAQQIGGTPGAPANQNTAIGAHGRDGHRGRPRCGDRLRHRPRGYRGCHRGWCGTSRRRRRGGQCRSGVRMGGPASVRQLYQQCMYSKGNQIPGVMRGSRRGYGPPPRRPPRRASARRRRSLLRLSPSASATRPSGAIVCGGERAPTLTPPT